METVHAEKIITNKCFFINVVTERPKFNVLRFYDTLLERTSRASLTDVFLLCNVLNDTHKSTDHTTEVHEEK